MLQKPWKKLAKKEQKLRKEAGKEGRTFIEASARPEVVLLSNVIDATLERLTLVCSKLEHKEEEALVEESKQNGHLANGTAHEPTGIYIHREGHVAHKVLSSG